MDSFYFPRESVIDLMKRNAPQDIKILKHLNFENRLCHECNHAIPSYRYCHEMYGTVFVQTYGWYINKKFWEYGINPMTYFYLPDKCPQEIIDIYGDEYHELVKKQQYYIDMKNYSEANQISSEIRKIGKRVRHFIENEVRMKFGHKQIGETWTSETVLYYIIKRLFPNKIVRRHYRPDFLNRLELDIFIQDYNLGIEFQGIQHFKPVKHWGGKEALKIAKERDKKKKYLCEQYGVKLIYFYYYDNLSEDYIKKRLFDTIGNIVF